MHFFQRLALLLVLLVAAIWLPTSPAAAQPGTITSLSCYEDELRPGDKVVLEHDVTCETIWWEAVGVDIDLNGHTVTATSKGQYCGWEDIWQCNITLGGFGGGPGELKNGRMVGVDLGDAVVHNVVFDDSHVAWVEGDRNVFRNSVVFEGTHHQNSIFVDTHFEHLGSFDHNILVRSPVRHANWTGFHGVGLDIHHNWMIESDMHVDVELNAPGDVRGTIASNLLIGGSIDISGVLGPTMGAMSITDNTIVRGGIQVVTAPPEFGIGGPLSIARNTIWFSSNPIHINSPFVLGDLSGNKAIFSARCVGVTCSRR